MCFGKAGQRTKQKQSKRSRLLIKEDKLQLCKVSFRFGRLPGSYKVSLRPTGVHGLSSKWRMACRATDPFTLRRSLTTEGVISLAWHRGGSMARLHSMSWNERNQREVQNESKESRHPKSGSKTGSPWGSWGLGNLLQHLVVGGLFRMMERHK